MSRFWVGLRRFGAAAALLGLATVAGCGKDSGGSAGTQGASKGKKGPKVLFISNSNSDWWSAVKTGMDQAAEKYGVDAELKRNDKETPGQITLLEDALSRTDVQGVAVSVYEAKAPGIADAMRALQRAGKIVIVIDSDIEEASADARTAYIGTDNFKAGQAAGKAAAALRPKGGKVCVFVGTSSAANAVARREGFFDGAGKAFVQQEIFDDGGDPNRAQANVTTAITKFNDVGVLLGLWSYNAPMIAEEVKGSPAIRKTANVVTFDLDEKAVAHIEEGNIDVTVCQNPYEMGFQGIRLLKALIEKDDATVKEILPDGKTRDTGVRVIVSKESSPVKGKDVITIGDMKKWLTSKGLRSS